MTGGTERRSWAEGLASSTGLYRAGRRWLGSWGGRPAVLLASRPMPDSMFLKLSLILGLLALGPHVCSWKFEDISRSTQNFRLCVEFAVFHFNEQEPDEYAYKLLWVGRSQRKVRGMGVGDGGGRWGMGVGWEWGMGWEMGVGDGVGDGGCGWEWGNGGWVWEWGVGVGSGGQRVREAPCLRLHLLPEAGPGVGGRGRPLSAGKGKGCFIWSRIFKNTRYQNRRAPSF